MKKALIYVYVFKERSPLIAVNNFTDIDRHLITILHDEPIYDVLTYVGKLDEEEIRKYITQVELKHLKKYSELIIKGKQASTILKSLNVLSGNANYLILRLFYKKEK